MKFEQLPERVREVAKDADEWGYVDAADVPHTECAICGDDMFRIEPAADADVDSCWHCGDEFPWVNDWGEVCHRESVYPGGFYEHVSEDHAAICGHCMESFGYDSNTAAIVVGDETAKVEYQGDVFRDVGTFGGDETPVSELPKGEEIVEGLVTGTRTVRVDGWRSYEDGPSEAGWLTKVSSGWHSSMERSEVSDAINMLTSGEFGLPFAVAVVFGRTSNVCSVGIDVYAPEDEAEYVKDLLSGDAEPRHAGLR